jgi:hypothetical protein
MHPLMNAAGHRLLTPSYTGLGERVHLASPSVDLETHIQDILNVITYEDLRDIVLLGHPTAAWSRPASPTARATGSRSSSISTPLCRGKGNRCSI